MKKIFREALDFFADKEDPKLLRYDPVHMGGMIVISFFAMTVLFWLLWALMVFGGGLQAKIIPLLSIIVGEKKADDYGYVGYPYEMGVFEGWITNLAALAFLVFIIFSIAHLFNKAFSKKASKAGK